MKYFYARDRDTLVNLAKYKKALKKFPSENYFILCAIQEKIARELSTP